MIKTLTGSLLYSFFTVLIFYIILYWFVPGAMYIVILNSVAIASGLIVFIYYWPLLCDIAVKPGEYNRARHYTIGAALLWIGVYLLIGNSAFIHSTVATVDIPVSSWLGSAGRFAVILAAVFQVTAPDLGEGMFHGRDRRLLWLGLVIGACAGATAIYIQSVGL